MLTSCPARALCLTACSSAQRVQVKASMRTSLIGAQLSDDKDVLRQGTSTAFDMDIPTATQARVSISFVHSHCGATYPDQSGKLWVCPIQHELCMHAHWLGRGLILKKATLWPCRLQQLHMSCSGRVEMRRGDLHSLKGAAASTSGIGELMANQPASTLASQSSKKAHLQIVRLFGISVPDEPSNKVLVHAIMVPFVLGVCPCSCIRDEIA